MGGRANFSILSSTLNALVTIFVKIGKVLPKFLVGGIDKVTIFNGCKLGSKIADGRCVEFVLVRLFPYSLVLSLILGHVKKFDRIKSAEEEVAQ